MQDVQNVLGTWLKTMQVIKVFHTQINKNARLFFLLGFNKEKLKSNTEMVFIFKMSYAIIENIAICIFLFCWYFVKSQWFMKCNTLYDE